MAARPRISNEESEILRMQEEYLAGKIPISDTQVVRGSCNVPSKQKKRSCYPLNKPSLFSQKKDRAEDVPKVPSFEFPKIQVLKDVVEKVDLPVNPKAPTLKRSAFPEVLKMEKSIKGGTGSSIFAQQMKKAKPSECNQPNTYNIPSFGECSSIVKTVLGESEAARLHRENVEKLSSMTREEILQEQQQLMQSLDPKLISFLKSKRTQKDQATTAPQEEKVVSMEIDLQAEEEPEAVRTLKNPKWIHMDKVEKEKTRWMSSLPPIKELKGKSFQARFDFNGKLLPADTDLPVESALYHHGEEPERAGYSVNELMILSRSEKIQQRVLALNTLGKVLEHARLGTYDSCFDAPLIPSLLENGFLLFLRHCLDDNAHSAVSAALVAFSYLISCPFEETCLDRSLLWYGGEEQPDLCSGVQLDEQDTEQEEEMKDDEMAAVDVIKACLRMDVPFRIRYIIEELRPESRAVLAALSILTRIARHSLASAKAIVEFPRLIESILKFFLPKDWQTLSRAQGNGVADNLYGLPVRQALRLARVIASWTPEMARRLVSEFSLLESIKIYVAMETADLKLPTQEGLLLVLDCYHTWRTLLRQGVGVEDFIEFFPVWIRQLRSFQSSVSMEGAGNSANVKFSHQLGTSMFLMMEAFVGVCCRSGEQLHFGQVGGLREVIEMCVAKWSWQLRQTTELIPESSACLLAAALHFLATFFSHWVDSQTSSHLDNLCSSHVLPLLHSTQLDELACLLAKHSNLISNLRPHHRCPDALPSLNATSLDGQVVPVLLPCTPFPLPTSIFRLLRVWEKKSTTNKVGKLEPPEPYVDYLRKVAVSSSILSNNWFTRFEIWFVHEFLMLSAVIPAIPADLKQVLHRVALTSCSSVPSGHVWVAADWMKSIIFNRSFLEEDSKLEACLERLHISESEHQTLLSKAYENLEHVAAFYVKQFYPYNKQCSSSAQLVFKIQQIFPDDWIYAPLVALYTHSDDKKVKFSDSPREMILRSLQASYVFLSTRPSWFFRIRPAAHYVRLACIFLASNDLFLDEEICNYSWPILRGISTRKLDFTQPVEGVQDLITFYDKLIIHFEAVSYGSPLFGAFLLLPTRQKEPLGFRMKLWCEHSDAIRCVSLNSSQLLAPFKDWLEPTETDEILLKKYAACVKAGIVTSQRNPAVYEIAQHHLSHLRG